MDMGILVQMLTITGNIAPAVIWICKSIFSLQKEIPERINKILEKLNDKLNVETQERHES